MQGWVEVVCSRNHPTLIIIIIIIIINNNNQRQHRIFPLFPYWPNNRYLFLTQKIMRVIIDRFDLPFHIQTKRKKEHPDTHAILLSPSARSQKKIKRKVKVRIFRGFWSRCTGMTKCLARVVRDRHSALRFWDPVARFP
jgi:hypothetical protein